MNRLAMRNHHAVAIYRFTEHPEYMQQHQHLLTGSNVHQVVLGRCHRTFKLRCTTVSHHGLGITRRLMYNRTPSKEDVLSRVE